MIFYSGTAHVDGRASRWDVQDYSVIIETWLKKADLRLIRNYIIPGAVGELYNILGRPRYYDKTWTHGNTLRIRPSSQRNHSSLIYTRPETLIYVKNISDSPLPGNKGWIQTKIEGSRSGNNL